MPTANSAASIARVGNRTAIRVAICGLANVLAATHANPAPAGCIWQTQPTDRRPLTPCRNAGGEGGIRTRERRLAPTRFPVAPIRPLWHLSAGQKHSEPGRQPGASGRASIITRPGGMTRIRERQKCHDAAQSTAFRACRALRPNHPDARLVKLVRVNDLYDPAVAQGLKVAVRGIRLL